MTKLHVEEKDWKINQGNIPESRINKDIEKYKREVEKIRSIFSPSRDSLKVNNIHELSSMPTWSQMPLLALIIEP